MDYYKLLLDNRWLSKRKKILKRDQYRCTNCGSDKLLVVHHTYYLQQSTPPWQYPDNSLLTLCNICHDKYHKEHELTIRSHHIKSNKKKKVKVKIPESKMTLKQLYNIWEPRLKSKKYKLL